MTSSFSATFSTEPKLLQCSAGPSMLRNNLSCKDKHVAAYCSGSAALVVDLRKGSHHYVPIENGAALTVRAYSHPISIDSLRSSNA